MPRLGLPAFRLRILVRSVFVLLALATVALSVVVLKDEKDRAWQAYQHGFARSQAEVMARLHSAVLGDTVLPTIDGLLGGGSLATGPDLDAIDTDNPALAAAGASVARISGIAYACGTMPSALRAAA